MLGLEVTAVQSILPLKSDETPNYNFAKLEASHSKRRKAKGIIVEGL
jgi:hypothetical protein